VTAAALLRPAECRGEGGQGGEGEEEDEEGEDDEREDVTAKKSCVYSAMS
jgi:hypothetical protein